MLVRFVGFVRLGSGVSSIRRFRVDIRVGIFEVEADSAWRDEFEESTTRFVSSGGPFDEEA